MKSIYFTFSILLSILLSSCARKAGEALFDDFSNAINLVIVDSIDLEELNILNPHNIIYKRNTIVFRNLGTKQLLQFLNLKDGRIASKNILGDGPNEVSSYGIITSADPLKLHVADPTTSKILEVDIDSIWIDSSYHPRNIDMYSTKQHALVGCENERYIFRNGYFEEARFMRYDKTNCTVDFFSEYPDIEELNLLSMVEKGLVFGGTSMTADSSHLVACVHGLLDFYHLDENGGIKLINSHYYYLPQFNVNLKGRSILSFEASSPEFFFNGIKSTENQVYVLYSGRDFKTYGYGAFNCNTLLAYDWEGNPIACYHLEKPLYDFTFVGDRIYGLSREVEPKVYIYELPE